MSIGRKLFIPVSAAIAALSLSHAAFASCIPPNANSNPQFGFGPETRYVGRFDANPEGLASASPRTIVVLYAPAELHASDESNAIIMSSLDATWPPIQYVWISSFTDSVGSVSSNREIALSRATLVSNMIIGSGVDSSLVCIDAWGEEWPNLPQNVFLSEDEKRRVVVTVYRSQPAGN